MLGSIGRASLVLLLGSGLAFAVETDKADQADKADKGGDQAQARGTSRDRLRQEIFDQIRAMRMWKVTEELKLDEAAAAKVFPLLAKYDERQREVFRERGGLFHELHGLMRSPGPDPAKLTAVIDRMAANQIKRLSLEEDRLKDLRRVLTPVQQAKFILLLPQLEESVRRKIREVVGRERGRQERPDLGQSDGDGGRRRGFLPD
jgi:Spy/CpxP family protein refolding chaperone